MVNCVGGDDLFELIVEYPDFAIDIGRQHRMGDLEIEVLEHDDTQMRVVPAERAQGGELGNGVILADTSSPNFHASIIRDYCRLQTLIY